MYFINIYSIFDNYQLIANVVSLVYMFTILEFIYHDSYIVHILDMRHDNLKQTIFNFRVKSVLQSN